MSALKGITVISIEQALAAPLCTARLAEAGARVIKVERKEGDFARGYDSAANGASSYFTWTNQGKESVVLNFREEEDAELLESLIAKADVFIQNLAPDAMARAGFGSKRLRKDYPSLVTVDITGYGEDEAVKHLKAYDFLIQAESGLTAVSGGENEMGRIGVSICDIGAGMTAHAAVIEALLKRARFKHGSAISISLFDVAADWMSVPFIHGIYGEGAPRRVGLKHPSMAPYGAFETKDGELTLISIQNNREWERFCIDVLISETLLNNQKFISNNSRVMNRDELDAIISKVTTTLNKDELKARLIKGGIAFGGINNINDLSQHPALTLREVTTDNDVKLKIPTSPIRWLDAKEVPLLGRAPALGEHTDAIRNEFHSKIYEEQ